MKEHRTEPTPAQTGSTAAPQKGALRQGLLAAAVVLVLASVGLALGLYAQGCGQYDVYSSAFAAMSIVASLIFTVLGVLIVLYRPHNPIGWLMLVVGFSDQALDAYIYCSTGGDVSLPGAPLVAWAMYAYADFIAIVPLFILLPFLYPNGRFLSPHWRRVALGGLTLLFVARSAMGLLLDFRLDNAYGGLYDVDNPFGVVGLPSWWYPFFRYASLALITSLCFTAIASIVVRFRRAEGVERLQMKWLAYFLITVVTVQLLVFEIPGGLFYPEIFETIWYELILFAVIGGFALTIGIALFRYRLYDIDLIIKRTLLYGMLTALLALVYFGCIISLQRLFTALTGRSSDLAIVLSTLVIAVLFNPLRIHLQRWIDHRFYRRRYDAQKAMQEFAATARDEVDTEILRRELHALIDRTVQPVHVSIWVREE